jgi:putative Mn2+ efflux pump MntP
MAKVLMLACVLSVDTLIVSIALGTLGLGRSAKRNLVLLFSLCDSVASVAGWFVGEFWLRDAGALFGRLEGAALGLYAALVIALGWSTRATLQGQRSAKLFYALPLLLSLDNFATGFSLDVRNIALSLLVVTVGLASGLMSILGLQIGSVVRRHSTIRTVSLASAGLMCILAAMSMR